MKNKDVNHQVKRGSGKKIVQKAPRMSGDHAADNKIHRKMRRTSKHQI